MFKHILIPTDGSDLSQKALLYGVQLARDNDASVTALTVKAPFIMGSIDMIGIVASQDQFEAEIQRFADETLSQAKMAGESFGVAVEVAQDIDEQPYRAIIACAKAKGCDLIVMASHGRRGLSALLLGSETTKVLTHSHIPVLVYR